MFKNCWWISKIGGQNCDIEGNSYPSAMWESPQKEEIAKLVFLLTVEDFADFFVGSFFGDFAHLFFEKLPGSTEAASTVAVVEESFGRSRSTSRLTKLCRLSRGCWNQPWWKKGDMGMVMIRKSKVSYLNCIELDSCHYYYIHYAWTYMYTYRHIQEQSPKNIASHVIQNNRLRCVFRWMPCHGVSDDIGWLNSSFATSCCDWLCTFLQHFAGGVFQEYHQPFTFWLVQKMQGRRHSRKQWNRPK